MMFVCARSPQLIILNLITITGLKCSHKALWSSVGSQTGLIVCIHRQQIQMMMEAIILHYILMTGN